MNVAATFVRRPVATILLTVAISLLGCLGFWKLPVSIQPEVDLPAISVSAQMPGASPATMATNVATPLERHLSAISDVMEMRSISLQDSTNINLTFQLGRDINGAARDVQAAIDAARADLPSSLSGSPSYQKVSNADSPIILLSLTSSIFTLPEIFEAATNVLKPQLASISGVGHVDIVGSSPEAVHVELDPNVLAKYGISPEDVRAALSAANANSPKGAIDVGTRRLQIYANDKATKASDYRDLIVAYRDGLAVRLSDLAVVENMVEDPGAEAFTNWRPSILVEIFRLPHANIIQTVERVKTRLATIQAALPTSIDIAAVSDRTAPIRASLRDLEKALLLSGALAILIVVVFLQSTRAIFVPLIAVPVSILGTFGIMALCGYSLDAISLMALIIATGLVIDDLVIVLENIVREIEAGLSSFEASVKGVRGVGFTVIATSLALITIFVPFLFMGDVVGRVLREFAMTITGAILMSLIISLTVTPTICALVFKAKDRHAKERFSRVLESAYKSVQRAYERSLQFVLHHSDVALLFFIAVGVLNVLSYEFVPKGLMPEQDPGRLEGDLEVSPNTTNDELKQISKQAIAIILKDPAVTMVTSQISGSGHISTVRLVFFSNPGKNVIQLETLCLASRELFRRYLARGLISSRHKTFTSVCLQVQRALTATHWKGMTSMS